MLLKFLPVSDNTYISLRYAFEVFIYLLFTLMVINKTANRKKLSGSPIDRSVLIFIGLTITTVIINNAPVFESFIGFKSAFRFLLLFYVLANFEFDRVLIRRMFSALILVAVLQSLIAFQQHFFGISQFWYPRAINLTLGSKTMNFKILKSGYHGGLEQGSVIGTFGDNVALATFLVIILIVLLAFLFSANNTRYMKLIMWGGVLIIIMALSYTYSRGSAIIGIICIPLMMLLARKTKLFFRFAAASVLILGFVLLKPAITGNTNIRFVNPKFTYVDPFSNITALFSEQYKSNTFRHARGWILENVGGGLLRSIRFFGYSPASEFALQKVLREEMNVYTPFENFLIINDVFWVAFIAYYGLAGLIIFSIMLIMLYRSAIYVKKYSDNQIYKTIALATMTLIIVSVPYSFIIATFTFRSFGIYFWLLAGLTVSEYLRLKKNAPT